MLPTKEDRCEGIKTRSGTTPWPVVFLPLPRVSYCSNWREQTRGLNIEINVLEFKRKSPGTRLVHKFLHCNIGIAESLKAIAKEQLTAIILNETLIFL